MTIEEILARCRHLKTERGNDISVDFVERVIFVADMPQWEDAISEMLGPAVKKAGEEVTPDMLKVTFDFGGLQDDQVLFYRSFGDHGVIAMFWPWKDRHQATLKIARFAQ